ncbi:hypothetical protein [uncultured Chryseobacterium sp.]|uniref:hypothetical protein n=1 Tax=uncultured Chryseobacterium sp. TaxID=259322 RepID=UPI0025E507BA|nr:hypothetical protein [uncultured Chryseobacterium sp.]
MSNRDSVAIPEAGDQLMVGFEYPNDFLLQQAECFMERIQLTAGPNLLNPYKAGTALQF